jgi:hypothetical protein
VEDQEDGRHEGVSDLGRDRTVAGQKKTRLNWGQCYIQTIFIYLTFSNLRPPKIYPNLDFWFESKPSGNPARS